MKNGVILFKKECYGECRNIVYLLRCADFVILSVDMLNVIKVSLYVLSIVMLSEFYIECHYAMYNNAQNRTYKK
jgi:hypothetical protein